MKRCSRRVLHPKRFAHGRSHAEFFQTSPGEVWYCCTAQQIYLPTRKILYDPLINLSDVSTSLQEDLLVSVLSLRIQKQQQAWQFKIKRRLFAARSSTVPRSYDMGAAQSYYVGVPNGSQSAVVEALCQ